MGFGRFLGAGVCLLGAGFVWRCAGCVCGYNMDISSLREQLSGY